MNVGAELTYRMNTTLKTASGVQALLDSDRPARGDAVGFLVNAITLLPRTALWDGGELAAELAYNKIQRVTFDPGLNAMGAGATGNPVGTPAGYQVVGSPFCSNAAGAFGQGGASDGCITKDGGWVISANFQPRWPQAFPGVDLSAPIFMSYGLSGNANSANMSAGQVLYQIGLQADVYQKYVIKLAYTGGHSRSETTPDRRTDRLGHLVAKRPGMAGPEPEGFVLTALRHTLTETDMQFSKQLIALAASTLIAAATCAAPTAAEVAELGTTLTDIGAIKAGNADGSIPAFDAAKAITKPVEPYKPVDPQGGFPYTDPFAAEKPLVLDHRAPTWTSTPTSSTTARNTCSKKYPGYRIDVYPTHRTALLPQWVRENTVKYVSRPKLVGDGDGIVDAHAQIPFPIPKSGKEAMWNAQLRYAAPYERADSYGTWLVDSAGNKTNIYKADGRLRARSTGNRTRRTR